jgi:hypothetical protein
MVTMPYRKPTPRNKILVDPLPKKQRGKTADKSESNRVTAKPFPEALLQRKKRPTSGEWANNIVVNFVDPLVSETTAKSANTQIVKLLKQSRKPATKMLIPARLMKHAVDTFGSEKDARTWLSIQCGALNNQTPSAFLRSTGDSAEVERILTCIDYGMIA